MTNDLISRSALIEWFSPYMHEDEAISPDVVIGDIEAAPAVDAVEVVRCAKCKHYNKQHESEEIKCCTINAEYDPDVGVWYGFVAHTPPDFYCVDGERETE